MRHRIKGRKLNRTASHRKALLRNLANQLFEHKEIRTTTAKAKEARVTIERLITYAKKGGTHHRRLAFGFLRQKDSIKTLFDEIAPAYSDRQGGYTRVVKLGRRQGDGAPMALLQLVGFEVLGDTTKPEKKKKSRKKEEKPVETETKSPEVQEAEVIDTPVEDVKKPKEEAVIKAAKETQKVDELNSQAEPEESKKEEPAESSTPVAEEKPVEETKPVEEEKETVEEIKSEDQATKADAEEKPEEEAKSDEEDEKKEK